LQKKIKGSARIIKNGRLQGWFYDENNLNLPIRVSLFVNEEKVSEKTANLLRDDILIQNLHPTGKIGIIFDYDFWETDEVYLSFEGSDYKFYVQRKTYVNKNIRKRELCIVHIGMHKTGSSSVQHTLSKNPIEGFSYFELGSENHSIPIYSMYTEHPERYHIHQKSGRSTEEITQYNKHVEEMFYLHLIKNEDKEKFIISGEDISVLSRDALQKFYLFLSNFFHSIQVIGYVRSPISFINSNVQELIKGGILLDKIDKPFPNYKGIFQKFDDIFGVDNVNLVHFDRSKLEKDDITIDFLTRIGSEIEFLLLETVNESMSLEALSILHAFNFYTKEVKPFKKEKTRQKLIDFLNLNIVQKTKFSIADTVASEVLLQNKKEVEWINNRLCIDIIDKGNSSQEGVSSYDDLIEKARDVICTLSLEKKRELNEIFDFDKFLTLKTCE